MNHQKNTIASREYGSDVMIFGSRAILEALESGREIERIFIQRDLNNPLTRELKEALKLRGMVYTAVPLEKLNRITRKNHQGAVCYLSQVSYSQCDQIVPMLFEQGISPLLVMLDRVTDVRNFGAICRTAECMGVNAVIIPERGSAMINGDAVKASAGALNRITVCRELNLKTTLNYIHESGIRIVGCSEKGAAEINNENLTGPLCMIMGSEEDGISPEYLKLCDSIIRIPLAGQIASLNVSVAAGMVLYEIQRQRRS